MTNHQKEKHYHQHRKYHKTKIDTKENKNTKDG